MRRAIHNTKYLRGYIDPYASVQAEYAIHGGLLGRFVNAIEPTKWNALRLACHFGPLSDTIRRLDDSINDLRGRL